MGNKVFGYLLALVLALLAFSCTHLVKVVANASDLTTMLALFGVSVSAFVLTGASLLAVIWAAHPGNEDPNL